ncbi:Protein Y57G11C.20 [Aphelenchoides avenae]|nr:Protein Y57G11C.20 [Aphelenchus avenae]
MMYPYSWPNVGSNEHQYIDVTWKDRVRTRLYINPASYRTAEQLETGLREAIRAARDGLCKLVLTRKRRAAEASNENASPSAKEARAEGVDSVSEAEKLIANMPAEKIEELMKEHGLPTETEIQLERAQAAMEVKRLKEKVEEIRASKVTSDTATEVLRARVEELRQGKTVDEEKLASLQNEIQELQTQKTAEAQARQEETRQRQKLEQQLKAATASLTGYQGRLEQMEARVEAVRMQSAADARPAEVSYPEGCELVKDDRFARLVDYVKVDFEPEMQRFVLKMNTAQVKSVLLSEELQYTLGFEKGGSFKETRTVAPYMPDIYGGVHALYVYAPNLVEPSIVGESSESILRIVKVNGRPGDMVEEEFLSLQHHKLLQKQFGEISIDIRTSTGRLVPFNWGDCTLLLNFRKKPLF